VVKTDAVGADDSQTARRAVTAAADVARLADGKLHVVNAYDPKSVRTAHLPAGLRHSANIHPAGVLLKSLSTIAHGRGLEVADHAATGALAGAVARVGEQEHADLIVVGNKVMKATRSVLGSIPKSIGHAAPRPVLVVDTEGAD
jgi:nucleotide-binding universal stress UspA family protein